MTFAILYDGRYPYIDVEYASEREAVLERANLLKHFPSDNAWHRLLTVAPFDFAAYRLKKQALSERTRTGREKKEATMEKKGLTILVIPVKGVVEARTVSSAMSTLQAIVGGTIELVTLSHRRNADKRRSRSNLLCMNENGIADDLPVNPRLTAAFGLRLRDQPLHGPGFIVAQNGFAWSSLTQDEVEAWTLMLAALDGLQYAPCPPSSNSASAPSA